MFAAKDQKCAGPCSGQGVLGRTIPRTLAFWIASAIAASLACAPAIGGSLPTPTFMWSTNVNTQTFSYDATVQNFASFSGVFIPALGANPVDISGGAEAYLR